MLGKVLFVLDGSAPPGDAARAASRLLPTAAEIVVLQMVPQLPRAWIAWPAFPDPAEDLANAFADVEEVARDLRGQGWNVSSMTHFSPLSAAEMDREILRLTEALQPDLICLALPRGRVRANIVREAAIPVLVAKLRASESGSQARGRLIRRKVAEPASGHGDRVMPPALAPALGHAGAM